MDFTPAVVAHTLKDASNWWQDVNQSPLWQDRIFHVLAAIYSLVAAAALVQFIRIQLRVPEYGWTTQKVFHFLNFLVNGVRCLVFIFRRDVQKLQPHVLQHILLDMPSLGFLTTYTLLVLFWAEIYYQARAVSTDGLRLSFCTINAVVYAVQIALWLILCWKPIHVVIILSKMFFAGVSLFAALGFLLYGGRCLSIMPRLKNFHAASCFISLKELCIQSLIIYMFSSLPNTEIQKPLFSRLLFLTHHVAHASFFQLTRKNLLRWCFSS